jgi:hypothetical protein
MNMERFQQKCTYHFESFNVMGKIFAWAHHILSMRFTTFFFIIMKLTTLMLLPNCLCIKTLASCKKKLNIYIYIYIQKKKRVETDNLNNKTQWFERKKNVLSRWIFKNIKCLPFMVSGRLYINNWSWGNYPLLYDYYFILFLLLKMVGPGPRLDSKNLLFLGVRARGRCLFFYFIIIIFGGWRSLV